MFFILSFGFRFVNFVDEKTIEYSVEVTNEIDRFNRINQA